MEGREILGLSDMIGFPLSLQASSHQEGTIFQLDNDNLSPAIKPEDMLVPLSELQPPNIPAINHLGLTPPATPPPALTPPATPPRTITPPVTPLVPTPHDNPVCPPPARANPPIPKIIICRKVTTAAPRSKPIQVNFQVLPAKHVPQITSAYQLLPAASSPSLQSKKSHETQVGAMTIGGGQVEHQVSNMAMALPQDAPRTQAPQTCDAEELIDEIVQMISSDSSTGGFQGLENVSFDASTMEASMEDLLFQLEASDSVTTSMDSEPASPSSLSPEFSSSVPVPSSQPSESFPAPLSVPLPSQSPSDFASSPSSSEASSLPSPAYLPSPVPSVGSLSPAPSSSESLYDESASCDDMKTLEEEWSPLEETHSYSRSQRKVRSSRRGGGARKTPYLEDRKERKKEQNKQAALRYRQKKKQEEDDLIEKIQAEEERQENLKSKYSGLKQELSYLKKIMREVFVARGLLSEEAMKKAALERKKSSK
ncbi:Activating transcription factor of chaperone [Portunus trituberculatus]|uniref:Activating transcription factor of chaperone n=2 Tax=Portunus trituberculatus TaxID=210409 RepID=A0A5B7FXZ3_PORTR|nr:Activating transcription factor of chaperone [Portunus trituberculatus]